MTIKKIGIVGYGSIGQKHHQILSSISNEYKFFIHTQQQGVKNSINNLESFSSQNLDYIIIANPTSFHYETLKFLNERYEKIKFLVEKPIFNNLQSFSSSNSNLCFVGYNLRFHQIIPELSYANWQDDSLIKGIEMKCILPKKVGCLFGERSKRLDVVGRR